MSVWWQKKKKLKLALLSVYYTIRVLTVQERETLSYELYGGPEGNEHHALDLFTIDLNNGHMTCDHVIQSPYMGER